MEKETMHDLRYPVGHFEHEGPITDRDLQGWIAQIAALPDQLREAVSGLSDDQLDTRYRPEGWTLRQVVHHVPDSHLNSYVRFKCALTEDEPVIKTYDEGHWAQLPDARVVPIATSLDLLSALHQRWVALLRELSSDQWARRFRHPESGTVDLAWNAGNYAWHGRHHLAHITGTIERHGWRHGHST